MDIIQAGQLIIGLKLGTADEVETLLASARSRRYALPCSRSRSRRGCSRSGNLCLCWMSSRQSVPSRRKGCSTDGGLIMIDHVYISVTHVKKSLAFYA
jgi:hypothetical protein